MSVIPSGWSSPPELSGPPAPPGDHGSARVSSWNSHSVPLASVATWSRLRLCGLGLTLVMLAGGRHVSLFQDIGALV